MTSATVPRPDARPRLGPLARRRIVVGGAVGVMAAAVLVFAVSTPGFLTLANGRAILASMAVIGIVAVGMSFITISGNLISTTLGTTVVVGSMVFLAALGSGVLTAIVATVLACAAIGAVQGLTVGALDANPIIVTIAFGTLQLGVAQRLTGQSTVYPPAGVDFDFLASTVGGLPVAVFVLIGLVIVAELWLRRSRLGAEFVLVGENKRAARAAGLRVTLVATTAFALAGAAAGIAGVLVGAAQRNATLLTSETYTWDAIAAVLVGGMAITGGRGAIYRTVLGALFIAIVSNALLLGGQSTGVQILVRGLVVLIVVIGMRLWRKDDR